MRTCARFNAPLSSSTGIKWASSLFIGSNLKQTRHPTAKTKKCQPLPYILPIRTRNSNCPLGKCRWGWFPSHSTRLWEPVSPYRLEYLGLKTGLHSNFYASWCLLTQFKILKLVNISLTFLDKTIHKTYRVLW